MADTGWVIATSYNNVAGADTDWVSQTAMLSPAGSTDYLECTGFDMSSVPSGATIDGIEVKIGRYKSFGTGNVRDKKLYLWFTGLGLVPVTASGRADTASNWPGSLTDATYGSPTDQWGTTWTDYELKDSSFAVHIMANEVSGTGAATAVVGDVYVKAYYTAASDPLAWLSAFFAAQVAAQQIASGNAAGRNVGTSSRGPNVKHIPIGY